MEASGQGKGPSWMPSGFEPDALREKLRSLNLGDSPAEVAASLRQSLQDLVDKNLGGSATSNASAPGAPGAQDNAAGATVQTPPFDERPELYVGAAFAGGLALAGVLRLLGR